MIPKEIKYNLHYDDVRGDFLWPPHGTTPASQIELLRLLHKYKVVGWTLSPGSLIALFKLKYKYQLVGTTHHYVAQPE